MSATHWYYEKDGNKAGPVDETRLGELIASGEVTGDSLVWREGLADWIPLRDANFAAPAGCSSPVVPPVLGGEPLPEAGSNPAPAPPQAPPPVQPQVFVPRRVSLKPDFDFGIGSLLGRAWSLVFSDFWPFVGLFALAFILVGVASNLVVTVFFLSYPILGGYMYYTLTRFRGGSAEVDSLFDGFRRRFGSLAVLNLIFAVPFFIVFILLLVGFFVAVLGMEGGGDAAQVLGPVVALVFLAISLALFVGFAILGIVTSLATLVCMDGDIGWKEAMGLSWSAFMRRPVKMTVYSVLSFILYQVGIIFLYFGIFVTGAWITCSYAVLYEEAFATTEAN